MKTLKRIDGSVIAHSETHSVRELAEENKYFLTRANLIGANLIGANLIGANLIEANLNGARLNKADLTKADLRGADLIGANLIEADLIGARLNKADLRGADLTEANVLFNGKQKTVKHIMGWTGLYRYWTAVYIFDDKSVGIKLGCMELTLKEWEERFWNNDNEFPNNKTFKSNMRKHAFDFALNYAKEWKKENG